ncbi:MAG: hypothetical protein ACRC6V_07045 [Bacteroidales bacterium]
MKLAIIAAAILSSSAAFANAGNVYFDAKQEASCSMAVIKDNAPIFFEYNGSADDNNYAQVNINSDFAKKVLITANGDWTDTSAWENGKPASSMHTMTEGSIGNSGDTYTGSSYEGLFELKSAAGQESSFFLGVQADKMTQAGTARMDAVVQISCE